SARPEKRARERGCRPGAKSQSVSQPMRTVNSSSDTAPRARKPRSSVTIASGLHANHGRSNRSDASRETVGRRAGAIAGAEGTADVVTAAEHDVEAALVSGARQPSEVHGAAAGLCPAEKTRAGGVDGEERHRCDIRGPRDDERVDEVIPRR